jgi:hypothetical protein
VWHSHACVNDRHDLLSRPLSGEYYTPVSDLLEQASRGERDVNQVPSYEYSPATCRGALHDPYRHWKIRHFQPHRHDSYDDANRPGRHQMQCASSENANEPILAANACPILVPKTD